jgi:hypothetical protein
VFGPLWTVNKYHKIILFSSYKADTQSLLKSLKFNLFFKFIMARKGARKGKGRKANTASPSTTDEGEHIDIDVSDGTLSASGIGTDLEPQATKKAWAPAPSRGRHAAATTAAPVVAASSSQRSKLTCALFYFA